MGFVVNGGFASAKELKRFLKKKEHWIWYCKDIERTNSGELQRIRFYIGIERIAKKQVRFKQRWVQ